MSKGENKLFQYHGESQKEDHMGGLVYRDVMSNTMDSDGEDTSIFFLK